MPRIIPEQDHIDVAGRPRSPQARLDRSHHSDVRGEHRYDDDHQTAAERQARQERDELKQRLAGRARSRGVTVWTVAAAVLMLGAVDAFAGRVCASQEPAAQPTSQALLDKALVSEFRERVGDYMKLHDKLQRQGTGQKQTDDVGENDKSARALAARLRAARSDARPGDLFTPPIAMALRRAMDPQLRGLPAVTTRESIREDAPEIFVLAVNAEYPAGASRATMPGNLLKILPVLPRGLEYRIVDTHLVLMDLDANIVVDYVLDVMCQTC